MSERKYNTSRYKYTGPDVKVHTKRYFYDFGYCQNRIFLCNEAIVIAEVNINVATVIGIVIHDEDYDIDPIYVAAKYLEPVKPEPIHFDPADDVDVPHFFDNLFSDIARINAEHFMPFMGVDWELSEKSKQELRNGFGWDCKTISELIEKLNDKWAEEHKQDLLNNDAKNKQWEKIKKEWENDGCAPPKKVIDHLRKEARRQQQNDDIEVDDDSKPIDWLAGKEEIKKLIDKLHVQCEIYTIGKGIESVKVYKETDGIRKNLFDWDRELTVSNEDFLDKVYQKLLTYDSLEVGGDHYQTAIQPWDFIYANHIPFDESCIIKYACRHKKKGGAEDVEKIISYAKHILKTQYNKDYE